ncbi:pollen-specific leucine-rich repeat extensin-like protein 1 [Gastrolobium bilobum]|uniref:pollen-specific leucine-rich repeat extensin-like protein 1 n=1 Tax=Gastrolobium bilobum TaxID=150636 RepID=UPI002AB2DFAD|nr:pollen-specific leucine-rich repeat extensin-like protein 1 [Gastrolobium bilobum]
MEEEPFWVLNGETDHRNRRRLRRLYSLFLTSTSLLLLLLVIALAFAFVVVPTLYSFASNIFKPHTVKRSWDSLNLVLVLFAIVCGFLSKNNTNETNTTPRYYQQRRRSFSNNNATTPPPWYGYGYENSDRSFNRLRSFNSYPDLRQHDSSWVDAGERSRFYDDTGLFLRHRPPRSDADEEEEMGFENVATVTSGEVDAAPPPPPQPLSSQSPPPPATRTKGVRRNGKQPFQAEMIEKPESNDLVAENSQPPPQEPEPQPLRSPSPPSPATRTKSVRVNAKRILQVEMESNDLVAENSQSPPAPPQPPPLQAERKAMQGKKKRGIATKEFLTSLRGKKKQRQRSVENFESILNSEPKPPPSPPPQPPSSVFHDMFSSKKSKLKKHHLVPVATHKPRLSNKREHSSHRLEDNAMISGNESPLIPIPPPPPLPPFNMPAWRFRVQGDFVRVDSFGSSRSGSPDLDEVVDSPTSQEDGEEPATGTSLFCLSPDVDSKAHTFIESFRAGLRMEKINSMKLKQGIGRSNLGPSTNPETIKETRLS